MASPETLAPQLLHMQLPCPPCWFQDGPKNLWLWDYSVDPKMPPTHKGLLLPTVRLQRARNLLAYTIWHCFVERSDRPLLRHVDFWDFTCWEIIRRHQLNSLYLQGSKGAWFTVLMDINEAFTQHKQDFQDILKQCYLFLCVIVYTSSSLSQFFYGLREIDTASIL